MFNNKGIKVSNSNVLAGMKCPKCGALEPLGIQITTMMRFTDEGEDFLNDKGADQEWDEKSPCCCEQCEYTGTVADFLERNQVVRPNIVVLSDQELNQCLAALRHWQASIKPNTDKDLRSIKGAWEHFDECNPMTTLEIDNLCERFNLGPLPSEKKG